MPLNLNVIENVTMDECAKSLDNYNLTYGSIGNKKTAEVFRLNILKDNIRYNNQDYLPYGCSKSYANKDMNKTSINYGEYGLSDQNSKDNEQNNNLNSTSYLKSNSAGEYNFKYMLNDTENAKNRSNNTKNANYGSYNKIEEDAKYNSNIQNIPCKDFDQNTPSYKKDKFEVNKRDSNSLYNLSSLNALSNKGNDIDCNRYQAKKISYNDFGMNDQQSDSKYYSYNDENRKFSTEKRNFRKAEMGNNDPSKYTLYMKDESISNSNNYLPKYSYGKINNYSEGNKNKSLIPRQNS